MATDIRQTATTGLDTAVTNYTITPKSLDSPMNDDENYYSNPDFKKNNGAYLSIAEYKKAIDTYSIWVLGNGISSDDTEIQVILDHLSGCGKDNAKSIFNNLLRMKKVNGDAYAEVIRGDDKDKTLLNLKPLNPERMTNVTNKKGILIGYDYLQADGKKKRFKPEDIFHLINDRIGDETHGHSVCECVEWIIEARKEAMEDWRRISHRATIRVLYVNEDDKTKFTELKRDYAEAIKKGEVLILPGKPEDANFQDLTLPPAEAFLLWIQYLENFFYQAVGIPKSVTGATMGSTEAGSKIGMVTFDPIYLSEIGDLQNDVWQQLNLKVSFIKQPSLMDNAQTDEAKNTGQTGFQKNDVTIGSGKA